MVSLKYVSGTIFAFAILVNMGTSLASTERVSISSQTPDSQFVAIRTFSAQTSDGRYVAFSSTVNGLVPGDNDNASDMFVRDRVSATTTRVLANVGGQMVATGGFFPSISADGRYVAFVSGLTNLVPGDTNGQSDIFVLDRSTGAVVRASVSSTGGQTSTAGVSPSLLFVPGVFSPTISADGRYVAFYTQLTGLVPGDTNGVYDVFVYDRITAITRRVSVSSSGLQADSSTTLTKQGSRNPVLSANGRYIAFTSDASNLVPGDTNGLDDVFLRDNQTGTVVRITTTGSTLYGKVDISADGRFVTYSGGGIYVYDSQTGTTQLIHASGVDPVISADGRYVAFSVSGQILVYDRQTGSSSTVSVNNSGVVGNDDSVFPSISADGTTVVFDSSSTNLVNDGVVAVRSLFANQRGATPSTIPLVGSFDFPASTGPVNLLQLAGSESATSVTRGSTLTFTFQVSNLTGSTTASGGSLNVVFPSQLQITSARVTQTNNPSDTCSLSLSSVCQLSSLAPGQTKIITYSTRANSEVSSAVVHASATSATLDEVTSDNAASLTFTILK